MNWRSGVRSGLEVVSALVSYLEMCFGFIQSAYQTLVFHFSQMSIDGLFTKCSSPSFHIDVNSLRRKGEIVILQKLKDRPHPPFLGHRIVSHEYTLSTHRKCLIELMSSYIVKHKVTWEDRTPNYNIDTLHGYVMATRGARNVAPQKVRRPGLGPGGVARRPAQVDDMTHNIRTTQNGIGSHDAGGRTEVPCA